MHSIPLPSPARLATALLLTLAACSGAPTDDKGRTPEDSDLPADTADSADTADTADSADSADTSGTADSADSADSGTPSTLVRITGVRPYDDVGRTIDVADLDADGRDDLLVGTMFADGTTGGGYLVPGDRITEGAADAVGWTITGHTPGGGAGRAVGLGDVDGDGVLDLGFGVPYATQNGVVVLLGPVAGDTALAGSAVALRGAYGSYCGHGMDLGDVDGDGIADGVAGAYGANPAGESSGAVYVRFGPLSGAVDLETEADATLRGEAAGYYAGRTLRAGDDLDGDGVGDLVIAAPYASDGLPYVGVVYVVYGPPGDEDLADADGRFAGTSPSAEVGSSLRVGDANGDGLADVLAGSWESTAARYGGAALVVFGPAMGSASMAEADIIVQGDAEGQYAGTGLAAGTVDGQPALLIGASGDNASAGAAYLFLSPEPGSWSVGDADQTWTGDADSKLGEGVALADTDGDGRAELVLGAPTDNSAAMHAGALWVIGL